MPVAEASTSRKKEKEHFTQLFLLGTILEEAFTMKPECAPSSGPLFLNITPGFAAGLGRLSQAWPDRNSLKNYLHAPLEPPHACAPPPPGRQEDFVRLLWPRQA